MVDPALLASAILTPVGREHAEEDVFRRSGCKGDCAVRCWELKRKSLVDSSPRGAGRVREEELLTH